MSSISILKASVAATATIAIAFTALLAPDNALAATKRTKNLTLGKTVSVRGVGCNLTVRSATDARIGIRCKGSPTAKPLPRGSTIIALRVGDSAVIQSQTCFLQITKQLQKRVNIQCVSPSTPTPTVTPTPTITPTPNANALLSNNQIITFNTADPAGAEAPVAITGLTAGDVIVSIDRRPLNGYLYGLGYNGTTGVATLYAISPSTGVATSIGASGSFVDENGDPARIGASESTRVGIDFNPAVDRLRVVAYNQQNFRMNPNSGALVDGDLGGSGGSVTGLNMDGATNGQTTSVQEAAYTNSSAGTSVTTLYTVDSFTNSIFIQNPPNAGTQTSAIAINPAVYGIAGFDIAPTVSTNASNTPVSSGVATVIANIIGTVPQSVATIDLVSGALVNLGSLRDGSLTAVGLALQSPSDRVLTAVDPGTNALIRFNSLTPETTTTVPVTGLTSGETLVGVDYRPSTGQLFGLGIDATADTGTLYRIDPQTAAATAIGSGSSVALVDTSSVAIDLPDPAATAYGVNFNPVVDRVRVVTGTGLNFRINPVTGLAVDSDANAGNGTNPDGNINGAVTSVSAASYTNSVGGAANTTLYTIDAGTNSLYIQNPANAGTETSAVAVTLNGSALDFSAVGGFEIPSTVAVTTDGTAATGSALAILTVAGITGSYTVDLSTGAATLVGIVGTGSTPTSGLAASVTTAK